MYEERKKARQKELEEDEMEKRKEKLESEERKMTAERAKEIHNIQPPTENIIPEPEEMEEEVIQPKPKREPKFSFVAVEESGEAQQSSYSGGLQMTMGATQKQVQSSEAFRKDQVILL